MKFHSLRRSLVAGVFAFFTAALVASCGGGGAATTTQGGAIGILPNTGSIYAGVPTTFTLVGGRAPYTLSSSEPQLLAVPTSVNGNSFTVIAANPGVIDVGLDPDAVPSRTVVITVRDATGQPPITGSYNVLQNFLTGYGFGFTESACTVSPPTNTTPVTGTALPSGCEFAVQFAPAVNGNRYGDRPYRLTAIRGNFVFVDPVTGVTSNSVTVRTDHEGRATAIIRTLPGQPTQIAILRIQDAATGVYTDNVFTITGGSNTAALSAIPNSFTFTGPDNATCGTGEADVFVFDGTPPYSAASSNPNVVVFPIDANSNPGVFRIRVTNSNVCLTNATVVFTDRFGSRTTATVTTEVGANPPPAPPTPPVSVSPTTMTLACGQSASASITGGNPPYSASSSTPGVTAVVTTNTVTITRAAVGTTGAATPTTTAPVNVTDGATIATVNVTVPTTCP